MIITLILLGFLFVLGFLLGRLTGRIIGSGDEWSEATIEMVDREDHNDKYYKYIYHLDNGQTIFHVKRKGEDLTSRITSGMMVRYKQGDFGEWSIEVI